MHLLYILNVLNKRHKVMVEFPSQCAVQNILQIHGTKTLRCQLNSSHFILVHKIWYVGVS